MLLKKKVKRKVMSWGIFLCILLAFGFFTGCGISETAVASTAEDILEDPVSASLMAMDTVMNISAYGTNAEKAIAASEEEIMRLDTLLSVGDETSEVYLLNQNGGGELTEDARILYEKSIELWNETDGLFDVAIYPLMQLWGFTNQNYHVPSTEQLKKALMKTDASQIHYDSSSGELFFLQEGMGIDFGGIAKGYTSSRIIEIMKENGVESGIVNLGGNVHVLGTKPDGCAWKIAIRDPQQKDNEYLGILEAADCAVITSGGYERFFEQDGVTYHHIINPKTGYPANSGLISVSIVSTDGMLADGLSTTLFVMGLDEATNYWRKHSTEFDFIIFDGTKVYITERLQNKFYDSPYEVELVEK